MQTHIQKWGNSLGIRIPARLAQELQMGPGTVVDMAVHDHQLVISTVRHSLDDLLDQITNQNRHYALLDGDGVGEEEW